MIITNLDKRHVKLCKEFASFRRTLAQASKLLDEGMDANPEEVSICLQELETITPTVEALQFAIRGAIL